MIADKPKAIARTTGVRCARWRDVDVVNHFTCFNVNLFQGGYVVCSGVRGRRGAGQRAGASAGIAFEFAGEIGNGKFGGMHIPGCSDVAATS